MEDCVNEKKTEKDSDDFWHRKMNLKVKFLHFLTLFDTSPFTQFSKFTNILWVCWSLGKKFPILYTPIENSTTRTAILFIKWLTSKSCYDFWKSSWKQQNRGQSVYKQASLFINRLIYICQFIKELVCLQNNHNLTKEPLPL